MTFSHIARLRAGAVLCLVSLSIPAAASRSHAAGVYVVAGSLPRIVDGQVLRDFAFDATANRLFACSKLGLFWSELSAARLSVKGPLLKKDILRIEMAPEADRLFYFTEDEIGFVDVRHAPTEPVTLLRGQFRATELVYEPTRQEVYVATRSPRVLVIDAITGAQARDVAIPGWYATGLEATPGRVFMNVASKNGIYQIDAVTHAVTEWDLEGTLVTPVRLESDSSGRTLFAAYGNYIVAIETRTGKEVGRLFATSGSTMAFDPGTGLLVASWGEWQRWSVLLRAFRTDASSFTEVAAMDQAQGGIPVGQQVSVPKLEPLRRGFLQIGGRTLLVWKALNAPF